MAFISTYIVPILWAVLFHVLVVGLLLFNWEDEKSADVTEVQPYFIEASIVSENPHRAREKRETAEAAAREQARRQQEARVQAEQEAAARATADRQARLDAEQIAQQQQEREAELRRQREALEQQLAEAEAAQAEEDDGADQAALAEELARAVMSEQSARQAVTDYEKAMAYAARIRQDIIQQWSRPPSARNGMEALLQVSLVPTGEVVDVKVVEGSGNDAFDRSAIQAVEKAQRFVVPDDSREFETHFRSFEVLFRPEDLRL